MSSHFRVHRAVIAAAAVALPLSLLPLASAAADPTPPPFSYLDTSATDSRVLFSANADGSSPVALTPAGYQTKSFDVTQDGQTEILGLCHGSAADCSFTGATFGFLNMTMSLVLVHHDAVYGTRSVVLASYWDVKPTLTAAGDPVWVTDGTLYKAHFDYSTAAWATTPFTPQASSAYDPGANGFTDSLAVSADGSQVGVLTDDGNTPATYSLKVGAFGGLGSGGTPFFTASYPAAVDRQPASHTFTFLDATHFAFGTYLQSDETKPPEYVVGATNVYPIYTDIATLSGTGGSSAENTALKDTYLLTRYDASSGWYAWKDHAGVTLGTVASGYALVTGDPTTSGATTVSTFTDRSNGDTTTRYVPTASAPPVLGAADLATNRSKAHPFMRLRLTLLPSNAVDNFLVLNEYYQDAAQGPYDETQSNLVSVGELQYSYDKVHWYHAANTQGASQKTISGFRSMGSTQKLTRNTWLRWYYKGDLMTAPGSTSAQLVRVAPTITTKVTVSGSKRTVSGSVLRSRGKMQLLQKVGTKYKLLATVAISSKGAYSFGKRSMVRGTYEVVSVADAAWAASAKVFKV